MFEALNKLLKSNGTLILLAIILAPYLTYTLFKSVPDAKHILIKPASTKTLEEIMHPPSLNTASTQEWDKDWHSEIQPLEK